jgi:phosphatidylethanolamine/phosphatidyl-N-methylethanolamine N-methyltransferase
MPLFEREETIGSEAATRAFTRTAVEHDFVERVYEKLSGVYDLTFGPMLHPGRLYAKDRLGIRPGDRLLEVGVGTGINASLYPAHCHVTGIDLSPKMLEKARDRVERQGLSNVRLLEMDATSLTFPNDSFDIVYAPYLISVVPDPLPVVSEMRRVCKPGGRIVILNHFLSTNRVVAALERAISPLTLYVGFKSDLELPEFLAQANLSPVSIEKVTLPIWYLVTSIKN